MLPLWSLTYILMLVSFSSADRSAESFDTTGARNVWQQGVGEEHHDETCADAGAGDADYTSLLHLEGGQVQPAPRNHGLLATETASSSNTSSGHKPGQTFASVHSASNKTAIEMLAFGDHYDGKFVVNESEVRRDVGDANDTDLLVMLASSVALLGQATGGYGNVTLVLVIVPVIIVVLLCLMYTEELVGFDDSPTRAMRSREHQRRNLRTPQQGVRATGAGFAASRSVQHSSGESLPPRGPLGPHEHRPSFQPFSPAPSVSSLAPPSRPSSGVPVDRQYPGLAPTRWPTSSRGQLPSPPGSHRTPASQESLASRVARLSATPPPSPEQPQNCRTPYTSPTPVVRNAESGVPKAALISATAPRQLGANHQRVPPPLLQMLVLNERSTKLLFQASKIREAKEGVSRGVEFDVNGPLLPSLFRVAINEVPGGRAMQVSIPAQYSSRGRCPPCATVRPVQTDIMQFFQFPPPAGAIPSTARPLELVGPDNLVYGIIASQPRERQTFLIHRSLATITMTKDERSFTYRATIGGKEAATLSTARKPNSGEELITLEVAPGYDPILLLSLSVATLALL